jgi:DNA-directed RNA polymerase subunit alpha
MIMNEELSEILAEHTNTEFKHKECFVTSISAKEAIDPAILKPIHDLNISVRASSILKSQCIYYICDLIALTDTEIFKIPGVGKKQLDNIKQALASRGLTLFQLTNGINKPTNGNKSE